MNSWGKQSNGSAWQVAITNPMDKTKSYGMLPLQDRAVVTSGDYEKHVTFEGVRYAHIIDPRSGYPSTGIISTTIFAPKAELADALSTAVFVMGIEAGLDRINQIPEVDCIIVDSSGGLHTSRGIELNYSK
jgi:thiamine biosynthesis lipoprotein